VVALLVVFILAGINAYERLPVEAYPDVSNLLVQVQTLWPGHAAEEVEQQVTIPIEAAMNGVPQRLSMRSISLFGLSQISLIFEDDADPPPRAIWSTSSGTVTLPPAPTPAFRPTPRPSAKFSATRCALRRVFRRKNSARLKTGSWRKNSAPCRAWWMSIPLAADQAISGAGGPGQAEILRSEFAAGLHRPAKRQRQRRRRLCGARRAALRRARPGPGRNVDDIKHRRGHRQRHAHSSSRTSARWSSAMQPAGPRGPDGFRRAEKSSATRTTFPKTSSSCARRKSDVVCQRVEQMFNEINAHYLPPGVKLVMYYDRTALVNRTVHTVGTKICSKASRWCCGHAVPVSWAWATGVPRWWWRWPCRFAAGRFMLLDLRGIPANLISLGAIDFGIIVDSVRGHHGKPAAHPP
jgi:heavy metal efflux system protein